MAYEDVATKSGVLGAAEARFGGIKTPGKGRWYKDLMKDPYSNSAIKADLARIGMIPEQVKQTITLDPEIAAQHPELAAQQINKAVQGAQNQGMADLIGNVGQLQAGAWQANLGRRMGIYSQQNQNAQFLSQLQAQMMRQKSSWWQTALKVGSPFLKLLDGVAPGVGTAASAGAAAIAG